MTDDTLWIDPENNLSEKERFIFDHLMMASVTTGLAQGIYREMQDASNPILLLEKHLLYAYIRGTRVKK